MCHTFISMYVKNFRLGYQFMMIQGHLNRDHPSMIIKKIIFKNR